MKYLYTILISIMCMIGHRAVMLSKWKYEIPITVSASLVDGSVDFTDMPYYIALSNLPAHFWNNVKANGDDIRLFTAPYPGGTELSRHVISFTDAGSSGTGTLFTKRTIDDAATTMIYLRYGNPSAIAPAAGDANGQYAVWSAIKEGWALTESASTFASLKSGGRTFNVSSGVSASTGKLEKPAPNQDGTSLSHGAGATALNLSSAGTYVGWMKLDAFVTAKLYYLFGDEGNDGNNRYSFFPNVGANTGLFSVFTTFNDNANTTSQILSASDDDTWVHWGFRHNAGTATIYKNGVSQAMADSGIHATITAEDTHWIGATNQAASVSWIDMHLYFTAALEDELVLALYRNQNTPATYHTVGNAKFIGLRQIIN